MRILPFPFPIFTAASRTIRLGLAAIILFSGGALARDWDPARTRVLVVCALEWEDSATFESFPKKNRRDEQLVNFFRRAGVPSSQIVYLSDQEATLAAIRGQFNRLLAGSKSDELLVVYYSGHGYPREGNAAEILFASHDANVGDVEGWSTRDIVATIEKRFAGNRALLVADCCHSGGLADAVKLADRRVKYGTLASSTSTETSTGNWTFTEALLEALGGAAIADGNADGRITLPETARFIAAEMKFAEEQESTHSEGPGWTNLTLANATPSQNDRIGAHVEAESEGDLYKARVRDVKDGKYLVFYYGYEVEDEEWVPESRLKWVRDTPFRPPVPTADMGAELAFAVKGSVRRDVPDEPLAATFQTARVRREETSRQESTRAVGRIRP